VAASQQAGGALMAHVVREDDNGIVVRGARLLATIGPFADELLVFPSTLLRNTPEGKQYSFACAIPNDAPGLRYLAREPLDYGRPRHDHPLGSRFEQSDAVVVFDDVHVPYERCFVLGDPELCNGFYTRTSAVAHMTHQVIARTTAKTEYILGLVSLLTEAIGIDQFQHVQADVAEVITTLEMLRAFGRAAQADAEPNDFGVLTPAWAPLNAARNLYPRLYQRFPEILRKLGASGLMATPTQADVTGPAAADIETYLQAAALGGAERVKLFRLVWDTCISAFSAARPSTSTTSSATRSGWPARTSTATTRARTRPPSAPSWNARTRLTARTRSRSVKIFLPNGPWLSARPSTMLNRGTTVTSQPALRAASCALMEVEMSTGGSEFSDQFGGREPADDTDQFGGPEPADDRDQFGGPEPADDRDQFGGPEPADDRDQFGGPEPTDDSDQFGGPEPADDTDEFGGRQ
jgi:hypothetical protein